jgi:hypothetical protein
MKILIILMIYPSSSTFQSMRFSKDLQETMNVTSKISVIIRVSCRFFKPILCIVIQAAYAAWGEVALRASRKWLAKPRSLRRWRTG